MDEKSIRQELSNRNEEKRSPNEWHCDIYCRKIRHVDCEGRKYVNENAPDLCPYFDEMLY